MFLRNNIIFCIGIFVFTQLIYLGTLYPDIFFSDSGELITSAYTLGISHPTGYSCYTLITHLISRAGASGSAAYRVNFLTSIWGSLTIVFLFLLFERFFIPFITNNLLRKIFSSSAVLIIAFTKLFWSQCILTEVYTFEWFIFVLLIYLIFIWEENNNNIILYLISLIFGIGFTHHLLTIILVPGLIVFLIMKIRNKMLGIPQIIYSWGFFLFGYSSVLYLPIRASYSPVINWWNPNDLSSFVSFITGGQFKMRMFTDQINPSGGNKLLDSFIQFIAVFYQQFGSILKNSIYTTLFSYIFGSIISIFLIYGAYRLYKISQKMFLFIIITYLGFITVITNYHIQDIESYYPPGIILMMIFILIGFSSFIDKIKENIKTSTVLYSIVIFPVILLLALNYGQISPFILFGNSLSLIARNYVENTLNTVEDNSIILTGGDYDIMPLWYGKYVLGLKKNVTIFGTNFLASPWYAHFFLYEKYLFKFKLSEQIYTSQLDYANGLISNVINPNITNRPVYITYYEPALESIYPLIPIANILPDSKLIPCISTSGLEYLFKVNSSTFIDNSNDSLKNIKRPVWKNNEISLINVEILNKKKIYHPGDLIELNYTWSFHNKVDHIESLMVFKDLQGRDPSLYRNLSFSDYYDLLVNEDGMDLIMTENIYSNKHFLVIPLSLEPGRYIPLITCSTNGDILKDLKRNKRDTFTPINNLILTVEQFTN